MFIFSRVIRYLPLALAAAAIVAPGAQATSAPESRVAAYLAAHWKHEDAIYGAKREVSFRLPALLEAHWNREDAMYAGRSFASGRTQPAPLAVGSGAGIDWSRVLTATTGVAALAVLGTAALGAIRRRQRHVARS